jgi:polyphosphate glucokinase
LGHIEIRGKDAEKRASDAARQKKDMSWEEWGEKFNEYLSTLERLFWPDMFVLGGGTSKLFSKFEPYLHLKAKVVPAQLLNQAGIIGAALFADMRHKEIA